MKNTLSVSDITDALLKDEYASWTYEGARALAEYLDNLDEEMGEDTELDVCAIRCDFSEYADAASALRLTYDPNNEDGEDEEDFEAAALKELQNNTTIIKFDGGIIIQTY